MLRVSLLALVAAGAFTTTARADCDLVGGFPANTTVTCDAVSVLDGPDAVETRGIDDGSDGITITVGPGATLDTTASGTRTINLGDSNDSTVVNQGTILSGDEGLQAGNGLTFDNTGTLEALEKGIDANGDGLRVTNGATGRIASTANEGIETGDDAVIVNFGLIEGFDDAIQVGETAQIDNYGTIRNTQTPAQVEPNTGIEAQDAIDIDSGTIRNFAGASITSVTNAAIDFDPGATSSLIENAGTISGTLAVNVDDADTASQTIVNSGLLQGTSGTALYLGAGDDLVTLSNLGTVVGDVLLGSGADMLVLSGQGFAGLSGALLVSGGEDLDMVVFEDYAVGDIFDVVVQGQDVDLFLTAAGGDLSLSLTAFEQFKFGTGPSQTVLSLSDLERIAAIPLPAGGLLLLGGLGLLGAARMRRRG